MALRINILQYNRFVFIQQLIAFIALVGLTAGWQADEIWMGFKISKIFYKLNY